MKLGFTRSLSVSDEVLYLECLDHRYWIPNFVQPNLRAKLTLIIDEYLQRHNTSVFNAR